jgi:uncharacterized membrane protein
MDYFILAAIAIVLVSVDFFYLSLIKDYFNHQIKQVQGSPIQINYIGAVLCYVFLVFGIYYFIIKPRKNIMDAFLLGIVIYGVYETTNLALLKNWTILTATIDTLWGGILFAMTTYLVNKGRTFL